MLVKAPRMCQNSFPPHHELPPAVDIQLIWQSAQLSAEQLFPGHCNSLRCLLVVVSLLLLLRSLPASVLVENDVPEKLAAI